jgi:hypothetical protein
MAHSVPRSSPVIEKIVVLSAGGRLDTTAIEKVAREFGWAVIPAGDICEAAACHHSGRTLAILFHRDSFGTRSWSGALNQIRQALPEALPIACHGFSDVIDLPSLSDAGLFHSLWLPFKENEVRGTFGFVWEARKRIIDPADLHTRRLNENVFMPGPVKAFAAA